MKRIFDSIDSKVCVICNTYNHAKYIGKCLDGFVKQKTTFKFRVIVHDDASIDGTIDILREYEKKYSELFYIIYEDENQYSKGINITRSIILPLVKEDYIALCEGDDYWSDPYKLQRQVDYMECHTDCSLCVHDTMRITVEGIPIRKVNGLAVDREYKANDVIAAGGGGLFQTSSFLFRTEVFRKRPDEISIRGIGDYPMAIHFAINGYVHYIGKVMSCYRIGDNLSWSNKTRDIESRIRRCHISYEDLTKINEFTNHKYKLAFAIARGSSVYFIYKYEKGLLKLFFNPMDVILVLSWMLYKLKLKTLYRIKKYLLNKLQEKYHNT